MATYVPNATQTSEPVESQTVESAALEFRTLKTRVNSLETAVNTEDTRDLRVPEAAIAAVPAIASRAGKVLGFDAAGDPVVVEISGATDPSLRADLAASSGAAMVGANAHQTQDDVNRQFVSAKAHGAIGDGIANDQSAIQAALNTGKSVLLPSGNFKYDSTLSYTVDGQRLFGLGNDSVLIQGAASAYLNTNGKSNVGLSNVKVDGTGANGFFQVRDLSKDVLINEVYFYKGGQRVWLFSCDRITVTNCTFNNTGYGVITQPGYSSNYVSVIGNKAFDVTQDFVEANSATVKCSFWNISNNVYSSNASYPTQTTEGRFVGITEVEGVIISGNIINKTTGDAAIHLEDLYGETVISGNVFDNCIGNQGYIYILNSAENTLISNNIFLRTDAALPAAYGIGMGSGAYNNTTTIIGNRFVGVALGGNFSGMNIASQTGAATLITSNIFQSLNICVYHASTYSVSFIANRVMSCVEGIFLGRTSTSNAGRDWLISENVFENTARNVFSYSNTSGTNGPKRWTLSNNVFSGTVELGGAGSVGSTGDAEDITASSNVFLTGATLSIGGTCSRRQRVNNVFHDPAAGGGTTLSPDLRNYSTDAAAETGGIPVGGMYRNGSVVQVRIA